MSGPHAAEQISRAGVLWADAEMDYVIDPPKQAAIPVNGGGAFPVRRVWCVGRNYLEHVREMGNATNAPPFFFAKHPDALWALPEVPYPAATNELHHEVELLVALGEGGRDIPASATASIIWGVGVAVDLTRRDLQATAKAAGRPWEMAKSFDASAPVGHLRRFKDAAQISQGHIWLDVNGKRRQDGDVSEMIWPVPDIISSLSSMVEIAPGDVILTGTPAGVGPLKRGDQVQCGVGDCPMLEFSMA